MTTLRWPAPRIAIVTLCALAACSSDNGVAPGKPGIQVLSGVSSDTIDAVLPSPLVIEFRDANGRPLGDTRVTFTGRNANIAKAGATGTLVFLGQVIDTTDHAGRAQVRVRLGKTAAAGGVLINVAEVSQSPLDTDSVQFTVRPGAPARVRVLPKDTTVYVDQTVKLRGVTVDRHDNALQEPVTYVAGPTLTADADGTIHPSTFARTTVVVHGDYGEDTASLSVVPHGRIIAISYTRGEWTESGGPLVITELDGSGYHTVGNSHMTMDAMPSLSPDGQQVAYSTYDYSNGDYTNLPVGELFIADLAGNATRLIPRGTFTAEAYPRWSRDGQWIYFNATRTVPVFNWQVWRIRPTGGAPEQVPNAELSAERPDPSPDGSTVVFAGDTAVMTVDVATGQLHSLGLRGWTARWSPAGDRIAIMPQYRGPMLLVDATSGATSEIGDQADWFPGSQRRFTYAFDWSPDGNWLVASDGNQLVLLQVDTGLRLPLAWAQSLAQPAWQLGS